MIRDLDRILDLADRYAVTASNIEIDSIGETFAAIRRSIHAERQRLTAFLEAIPDEHVGRRQADAWEQKAFPAEIDAAAQHLGLPAPVNTDEVNVIALAVADKLAGLTADEAEVDAAEATATDGGATP